MSPVRIGGGGGGSTSTIITTSADETSLAFDQVSAQIAALEEFDSYLPGTEYRPEWYGATGNGTTDDKAALQTAIDNAANNTIPGVVVLEPGRVYGVATMPDVKRGVRIRGFHDVRWFGTTGQGTTIKALSSMQAPLAIRESAVIGGAGTHGCGIYNVRLDGNGVATNALYVQGQVIDWALRDVEFTGATAAGLNTVTNGGRFSQELHMDRCFARANGTLGFDMGAAIDARSARCIAMSNGSHGWRIHGSGGFSDYFDCGAEWNGGQGMRIDGGSPMDGLTLQGFKTDSNTGTGIFVGACSDSRPIAITNPYCRRDGRGGSGYGIEVGADSDYSPPVILTAPVVTVKKDDDGTGIARPNTAYHQGGFSDLVVIYGGFLWGVTNHVVNDDAASKLHIARDTILGTGATSPTRSFVTATTASYTSN